MGKHLKKSDATNYIKSLESKEVSIFIRINIKENQMHLLEKELSIPDTCLFAEHPLIYSLKDVGDIMETLDISKVIFPNGDWALKQDIKQPLKAKPYQLLKRINQPNMKRYIFLLKRTKKLYFLLQICDANYICLARPDGLSLDILTKDDYILLFTDTNEMNYFLNNDGNKNKYNDYYPLFLSLKDIKRFSNKSKGFSINPSSHPVVQKDFSYILPNKHIVKKDNFFI